MKFLSALATIAILSFSVSVARAHSDETSSPVAPAPCVASQTALDDVDQEMDEDGQQGDDQECDMPEADKNDGDKGNRNDEMKQGPGAGKDEGQQAGAENAQQGADFDGEFEGEQ